MSILTKTVGFFIKFILFLVLLAILGIVLLLNADPNLYKQDLTQAFQNQTGIQLDILGPLDIKLFPMPKFKADKVTASLGEGDFKFRMSADYVEFDYDFVMFFKKKVKVDAFDLQNVKITTLGVNPQEQKFKSLQGQLDYSQGNFHINKLKFEHELGTFSGKVNVIKDIKTRIRGELTTPILKLAATKAPPKNASLFSSEIIPLKWLDNLDLQFKLNANKVQLKQFDLLEARFDIKHQKNKLEVKQSAQLEGGQLNSQWVITELAKAVPQASMTLNLKEANAANLLKHFNPNVPATGGRMRFELSGKGPFNHLQNFMGHLNGQSVLDVRQMALQHKAISGPVSVSGSLLNILSLPKVSKRQEMLDCAVAKVKITNGVLKANNQLGFETTSLIGLGSGQVNLQTEAIQLSFNLEPKKNLPFSIGDFENFVEIGGTLSQPKVQLNSMGALQEGASLLLGIPTMGLSIIAKNLVEMSKVGGSPCQKVLSSN